MAFKRQKNVYTNYQYEEKPSFISIIVRVFIGSSLILYGVIMAIILLVASKKILASLFIVFPIIGIKIIKGKSEKEKFKESFGEIDSFD